MFLEHFSISHLAKKLLLPNGGEKKHEESAILGSIDYALRHPNLS